LFGVKPGQTPESAEQNNNENNNFSNKLGSLERSQNSKSDSLSSYDSFNKQSNNRIGPNAHDDLKTTLSKIEPGSVQNSPSKYNSGPRWEQNSHRHNSKLDLKYGLPQNDHNENSPRNSREMEKESRPVENMSPRGSVERDIYRYSRSPAKSKGHVETKTDYGKYSRNNSSAQDYARTSHQDLSQSHLSVHQVPPHHHSPMKSQPVHHNGFDNGPVGHMPPPNANGYKPVPPPKPKNYKPPYKGQQGYGDGMVQPPMPTYQHGKSHSNPVDQRTQNMNYYYNMPQNNSWHTETAVRFNSDVHGHYDMAPPYETRRHPSISYASRSEITPIAQHENPYGLDGGDILMDARPPERSNIVDLQGSREQRGSAFELYRKPVHHNLR
jgi:hypothetical protein